MQSTENDSANGFMSEIIIYLVQESAKLLEDEGPVEFNLETCCLKGLRVQTQTVRTGTASVQFAVRTSNPPACPHAPYAQHEIALGFCVHVQVLSALGFDRRRVSRGVHNIVLAHHVNYVLPAPLLKTEVINQIVAKKQLRSTVSYQLHQYPCAQQAFAETSAKNRGIQPEKGNKQR